MKAIEVTGLVIEAMRNNDDLVDRLPALPRGAEIGEMHDLAVTADEQLGVGKLAGIDIAILQERIDPGEPRRIETLRLGLGDLHVLPIPLVRNTIFPIALSGTRINTNLGKNGG